MATPVKIHGIEYTPKWCEDHGPNNVIGHWEVGQHEPDCASYWIWYKDFGCTSLGSGQRRIEHYLENIPSGGDWKEFCATTPFSGVNAFLTLAATRHTISPAELRANSRADQIMSVCTRRRVSVHQVVSNLSEKNYLETLLHNASLISLLGVFAKGTHSRVLVKAAIPTAPAGCDTALETTRTSTAYLGTVSDRALLAYFTDVVMQSDTATHIHSPMQPSIQISQPFQSPKRVSALTASRPTDLPQPQPPTPTFTFATLLSCPLHSLTLPSLQVYTSVIAATSSSTVLDAMRLMSDCGVSSVAVVDDGGGGCGAVYGYWGGLTRALSVTDIGKLATHATPTCLIYIFTLLVSEHCAGLVTLWVTRANTGPVPIQQRSRALKIQ
ncbi:hypothetical protein BDR03DRAFT_1009852 [Suillus americanus]|nr:hypothetical protein BDR03DRAFT_1009852 [Suillus americanus]